MVKFEEIARNWERIQKHIAKAEEALNQKDKDDLVYFAWLAAENLVNALKFQVNGFFTIQHGGKAMEVKKFFANGILKRDYSRTIRELSKLRLPAAFHPYTLVDISCSFEDAKTFLSDIKSLRDETEKILKEMKII